MRTMPMIGPGRGWPLPRRPGRREVWTSLRVLVPLRAVTAQLVQEASAATAVTAQPVQEASAATVVMEELVLEVSAAPVVMEELVLEVSAAPVVLEELVLEASAALRAMVALALGGLTVPAGLADQGVQEEGASPRQLRTAGRTEHHETGLLRPFFRA